MHEQEIGRRLGLTYKVVPLYFLFNFSKSIKVGFEQTFVIFGHSSKCGSSIEKVKLLIIFLLVQYIFIRLRSDFNYFFTLYFDGAILGLDTVRIDYTAARIARSVLSVCSFFEYFIFIVKVTIR